MKRSVERVEKIKKDIIEYISLFEKWCTLYNDDLLVLINCLISLWVHIIINHDPWFIIHLFHDFFYNPLNLKDLRSRFAFIMPVHSQQQCDLKKNIDQNF